MLLLNTTEGLVFMCCIQDRGHRPHLDSSTLVYLALSVTHPMSPGALWMNQRSLYSPGNPDVVVNRLEDSFEQDHLLLLPHFNVELVSKPNKVNFCREQKSNKSIHI